MTTPIYQMPKNAVESETDTKRASHKRRDLLPRLTWLNLVSLLLLWLAQSVVAERHWMTTLLLYMPQHPFGVPTALMLLWALARRQWRPVAGNAAAALFVAVAFLGVNVPLPGRAAPPGTSLRVMTYNIHHASGAAARVAAVIEQARPDLVCLQEANALGKGPDPVPQRQRLLPGWSVARHGELATFSRSPIVAWRVHRMPGKTGRVILETAQIVEGRRLTVLNVHINTAATSVSLARRPGSLPAYLRHTADVRERQVAALLRVAEGVPAPVLVAGDFNTPPRGRVYRRLAGRFQDAFRAAGWGHGATYPARMPLLRIDYIFAGGEGAVRRCSVPKAGKSDHRPIVAELAFAGGVS